MMIRVVMSAWMVCSSVVLVSARQSVLRTTYEASSYGDDAFVQRVQWRLGGGGERCRSSDESSWYTEERASSGVSAEGIGGRDASRGDLLGAEACGGDGHAVGGCASVRGCARRRGGAAAASRRHFSGGRRRRRRARCRVWSRRRRAGASTVHHVAFDGASTGVFLGELQLMYDGMRTGSRSSCVGVGADVSALPFEYVDYALWQRSEALAPHLASQRAYWRVAA